MTAVVQTYKLSKTFKDKKILSDISLSIQEGEILGLLGPNGAGKTTLMKLLTNLIKPTSGSFSCFGKEIGISDSNYLGRIGALIDTPVLEENMTAAQNLKLHAGILGYNRENCVESTLKMTGFDPDDKRKVKVMSLGMKQRLAIAKAIITLPSLLILDEPINGLDPAGIREFRNLFRSLSSDYGISILISSHILSELELLVDRIVILQNGELIASKDISQIHEDSTSCYILESPDIARACIVLEESLNSVNYKAVKDNQLRIYDVNASSSEMISLFVSSGVRVDSFTNEKTSLEEFFISSTEEPTEGSHD